MIQQDNRPNNKHNINTDNQIAYLHDIREDEQDARDKYIEMKKENKYPNIRLIMSNHWATEGWWIEWGEEFKPLSDKDFDVSVIAGNTTILLTTK